MAPALSKPLLLPPDILVKSLESKLQLPNEIIHYIFREVIPQSMLEIPATVDTLFQDTTGSFMESHEIPTYSDFYEDAETLVAMLTVFPHFKKDVLMIMQSRYKSDMEFCKSRLSMLYERTVKAAKIAFNNPPRRLNGVFDSAIWKVKGTINLRRAYCDAKRQVDFNWTTSMMLVDGDEISASKLARVREYQNLPPRYQKIIGVVKLR